MKTMGPNTINNTNLFDEVCLSKFKKEEGISWFLVPKAKQRIWTGPQQVKVTDFIQREKI
jgi:hypothetical protein